MRTKKATNPMPPFPADETTLKALLRLVREAGEACLRYRGQARVRHKDDASPVTQADTASERVLLAGLATLLGDVLVISEEARALPSTLPDRFFLLDPLDGTKEFIRGADEFTINLGLIDAGKPVFGILHAPATRTLYFTWNGKAWRCNNDTSLKDATPIAMRPPDKNALRALTSRAHASDECAALPYTITQTRALGSALKFGLLAEGSADLYPRRAPTMEWDVAAGHAILSAAGGTLTAWDGGTFCYGKLDEGLRNSAFIAKHASL